MKTFFPKQITNEERKWYVIDAKGKTLGRLATEIAKILRGKGKVTFAAYVDNGDYVVVLNADKVLVTGKKIKDKVYYTHSGFLGGLKEIPFEKMKEKHPTRMLELAVAGMLPKTKLRDAMLGRLKLLEGATHPFEAQKPLSIEL